MIARMKKLTFLIYYKEYETFLKRMQELGVLHVQAAQEGFAEPTSALEDRLRRAEHVEEWINRLEAMKPADESSATDRSAAETLSHLDEMDETLRANEEELRRLRKDEAALSPWGDFDPARVYGLADIGYAMGFFVCPERSFKEEWAELYYAIEVTREKGNVYFVTLTPVGEEVSIDAERLRLPRVSLADLRKQIREKEEKAAAIEQEMSRLAQGYVSRLRGYEDELRTSIAFDRVVSGTGQVADNRLMVLQGWIPEDKEAEVKSFLSTQDIYYEIRAARKEDNAPIKLKNSAFVRMYEVLTKMYGMPDYAEFDPTPLVAPFFTLFFAFCMGDAGYGLVLIALGLFLKHKLSSSMKGMMNLVITLGAATTVFGAVLGTFFGVSLFDTDVPGWMKQFMIVGKIGDTSYDKQMLLALIIGVVHICIAMTVKAVGATVRYGFKESLSDWGWLLLVVGFICTGGLSFMKVISENVSGTAFLVIGGVAAVGIYLLNNLHRNVFVNIGAGLWDTYNMATGLMGDVLSYIRLYALGLAGGMLGGVFNQLAFMVRDGAGDALYGIPGWLGCGLILVFGHALNIAMSCLSAFVHPLRLTFVEYFKNSGYDGKGEAYEPFSIVKTNKQYVTNKN